jgi:hypothetical protein
VEALRPLERFGPDDPSVSRLVVAGAEEGRRHRTANVVSWRKIADVDWTQ